MKPEATLIFALISCIIAIIGSVLGIITFFSNRRDKAVKDAKEMNTELINFRLDKLDENVQKILDKMDKNENETDSKIEKALQLHIEMYHSK